MITASAAPPAIAYPWLRPAAASLLALTDDPPDADLLRDDPGLILHVLRYSRPTPDPTTFALDEATLCQPGLCETAAALLSRPDDGAIRNSTAEDLGRRLARLAAKLARETGLCSPDAAWSAGLLAPLALHMGAAGNPPSVARRNLARWRLPAWLQIAVGYLDLPLDEARGFGGHRGLNRILRAAIRHSGSDAFTKFPREVDAELDPLADRAASATAPDGIDNPAEPERDLLPQLLKMTARARGRSARTWIAPLEDRIDLLVRQLSEARTDFDHRLRDAKLEALSEFAAGASHEFNNPLAVISGNAQWLRTREADPVKAGHLQTILRQTQRIHDLLTGTRQFSCPSEARPAPHSVESLLTRILHDFSTEAERLDVRMEVAGADAAFIRVDGDQIRTAVGHLVRNALEAAGPRGWVKLTAADGDGRVAIHVDDSGVGPDERTREHLFDPFYCGRSAGRGRGLGLPIAWALARNNGGAVLWDASRPTRFTITLPVAEPYRDISPRQAA